MLNSIGLIESKGLVALIEAADVILKNSPVKILGIKKLENGLVSLAVFGDSDYVNAAIESAVEAGRRVGEIYASTVVDDPGKELIDLFSDLFAINNTIEDSLKKYPKLKMFSKVCEKKMKKFYFWTRNEEWIKQESKEKNQNHYLLLKSVRFEIIKKLRINLFLENNTKLNKS